MWSFFKKKELELPDFWWDYNANFNQKLPTDVKDNTFVVFDTETTGFNPTKDRMLCIGALKLKDNNIVVKDSLELYLKQEHYDKQSAEIHGILKKNQVQLHFRIGCAEIIFKIYWKPCSGGAPCYVRCTYDECRS